MSEPDPEASAPNPQDIVETLRAAADFEDSDENAMDLSSNNLNIDEDFNLSQINVSLDQNSSPKCNSRVIFPEQNLAMLASVAENFDTDSIIILWQKLQCFCI